MLLIKIVSEVIVRTPVYVWLVLGYLVYRGVMLTKASRVSLKTAWIFPSVFIVWGLEKVFTGFGFVWYALLAYGILLLVGAIFGYFLYSATQTYYLVDDVVMRKGSWLPLVIMLLNFTVKYLLNIGMSVRPELLGNLLFNVTYALISGFTVGLFVGGIITTVMQTKALAPTDLRTVR